jgi:hypothetical protein
MSHPLSILITYRKYLLKGATQMKRNELTGTTLDLQVGDIITQTPTGWASEARVMVKDIYEEFGGEKVLVLRRPNLHLGRGRIKNGETFEKPFFDEQTWRIRRAG